MKENMIVAYEVLKSYWTKVKDFFLDDVWGLYTYALEDLFYDRGYTGASFVIWSTLFTVVILLVLGLAGMLVVILLSFALFLISNFYCQIGVIFLCLSPIIVLTWCVKKFVIERNRSIECP